MKNVTIDPNAPDVSLIRNRLGTFISGPAERNVASSGWLVSWKGPDGKSCAEVDAQDFIAELNDIRTLRTKVDSIPLDDRSPERLGALRDTFEFICETEPIQAYSLSRAVSGALDAHTLAERKQRLRMEVVALEKHDGAELVFYIATDFGGERHDACFFLDETGKARNIFASSVGDVALSMQTLEDNGLMEELGMDPENSSIWEDEEGMPTWDLLGTNIKRAVAKAATELRVSLGLDGPQGPSL